MSEPFKFTISAGRNFGACAAKESLRYCCGNVVVAIKGQKEAAGYAIATDGRTLSFVPLGVSGPDYPMLLPATALKANGKSMDVTVNGEVRCTSGKKQTVMELPELMNGDPRKFPGIQDVFPKIGDEVKDCVAVTLNMKYLKNVADAVSPGDCVTLLIDTRKTDNGQVMSPVVVLGAEVSAAEEEGLPGVGLIVPLTGKGAAFAVKRMQSFVEQMPKDTIKFDE